MVSWQLLAIIGFSLAGGLLLALLLVISICIRRRRCVYRHHNAKIVELEANLKAIERENEAKEEAVSTLRRSVADFDAEKSLLLKRLNSCDRLSTQEDIRSCLRELQLHVAVQAANSSAIHKAVNTDYKEGPPALLAEVWLIHGETQKGRDESSRPPLGEQARPLSRVQRTDGACRCNRKNVCEDGVHTLTGMSTCRGPIPPVREFHTCVAHWAVPPCEGDTQLSPCNAPITRQSMETSAIFQTNTCALSEAAGGCCGDTSALQCTRQPTEDVIGGKFGTTRSCDDQASSGCPYLHEKSDWGMTPAVESSSSCQGAGVSTLTGDTEYSRTSHCCAGIKSCCETAVIPAHTFAPEYIFVAEQWLPGPCETAKSSYHTVPLARLAKFSRRDQSKTASLENELYAQVLPDPEKFEKVLISSKQTQSLHLVSSSRDHIKLQSRALAGVLPALHVSTKTQAFPHLRYSLVEYRFEQIKSVSKRSLKRYIGDTLHQPLSLVVRIFERKSVPGVTPPASPTSGEDEAVTEEEQGSWRFLYETPPVSVIDAVSGDLEDDTVDFGEGVIFHHKHTCIPPQHGGEFASVCWPCHSPVRKANEQRVPSTTQTADCRSPPHDSLTETTSLPTCRPSRKMCVLPVSRKDDTDARLSGEESQTLVIGIRAVRGERRNNCGPRAAAPSPRDRGTSPRGQRVESCRLAESSSADAEVLVDCRTPEGGRDHPLLTSGEGLISTARTCLSPFPEEATAASTTRFKNACLDQQGTIYEDEILSVSCVVGTTVSPDRDALHASVELSILSRMYVGPNSLCSAHGTKLDPSDQSCITGFHEVFTTVDIEERDAVTFSVTPIVRAPPCGPGSPARVSQTISATVMQPFQSFPKVKLAVLLADGSEKECTFELPLVIAHFMKPVELLPAAFMQLWYDGTLHHRRLPIRVSNRIRAAGPRELVKVATLNGKLAVVKGIKHRLAEGSIFAIGELAAIGDMAGESRCLIRVWQSHQASMARLEVKAEHRRLLDAVFELLSNLLQDSE